MKKIIVIIAIASICIPAFSQGMSGFGIHAGVGTDISLGIGFGGGASYALVTDGLIAYEFGIDLYYAHSDVSAPDGPLNYVYRDVTTTIFFAATLNTLFNYLPDTGGIYFIIGSGAGAANVNWVGSSTDDPTYNDSSENTAGGLLLNFGLGGTFGNGFELRVQVPVIIILGGAIVPLLNVAAGFRF